MTPTHTPRLPLHLVVSLDVARSAAAIYVVLHHLAYARGWAHGAGVLFKFGQEAVIVFFLLSGFLIYANESERTGDIKHYLYRRFRRIYPVLLGAMLTSVAVSMDNGDFAARFDVYEMLGTLLSLQDISALKPGVIADPFLGNDPLWSLSYEIVFYAMFPAVIALRNWNRQHCRTIIGIMCCSAYVVFALNPTHFPLVIAYFQLWWVGAMVADAYRNGGRNVLSVMPDLYWLVALLLVSTIVMCVSGYSGVYQYPALPVRHFAVGILFVVMFFGPLGRWISMRLKPLAVAAGFCASISYGLYALHYPIVIQSDRTSGVVGTVAMFGVLITLSIIADRHLNTLLPRYRTRATPLGDVPVASTIDLPAPASATEGA